MIIIMLMIIMIFYLQISGSDLRLKNTLDFETAQSHDLTITVFDGDASHNLNIQGAVTVGSVDEGAPTYSTGRITSKC